MSIIVWIEDDISIIDPVVYPLERRGHTFLKIGTIREAEQRIAEITAADLLILDLLVPATSSGQAKLRYPGLEFLEALRKNGCTIPTVVLSVIDDVDLNCPVEKVLRKPVLPSDLEQAVEDVLSRCGSPKPVHPKNPI